VVFAYGIIIKEIKLRIDGNERRLISLLEKVKLKRKLKEKK